MKKLFVLLLVVMTTMLNAQKSDSTKFIQKINAGGILSTVASTSFSSGDKPFSLGHNIFGSVTFVTKKTFHNMFYGFGDNSINSLNGYFLKKNYDTYCVFSKSLNTKGKYLGIGLEKMEKVGNIKIFEFCELGTNFKNPLILSFGLLMNVSWSMTN